MKSAAAQSILMSPEIETLFPEEDDIPEQHRIHQPIRQNYYLIGGELRNWEGLLQEVHSPLRIRTATGIRQQLLGEAPLLTEAAALETLAVAVRAYSNGRGVWPTGWDDPSEP